MTERISWSGERVYEVLKKSVGYSEDEYVVLVARRISSNPFLLLVSIILSQNTNDKNSIKALERFVKIVGTSCADVMKAPRNVIEKAIRPAGLYKQKADTIIRLAGEICKVGEDYLLKAPIEEVRRFLKSVKGIGNKTIDVFLSVARKAPVFAVDTHAMRIAKRWGLIGDRASYEEASKALLQFFGEDKAEEAHRLLISLGRRYCTARKPRCKECPLREACPYARRLLLSQSQKELDGVTRS